MRILKNSRGLGIIEVIIAAAIMGFLALGIAQLFTDQRRLEVGLAQKLEILAFNNNLISTMTNANVCTCQLNAAAADNPNSTVLSSLRFNSSTSRSAMSVERIFSGCLPENSGEPAPFVLAEAGKPLPGTQTGIQVESIRFTDIEPTGTQNEYQGYWQIDFTAKSMTMARKPVRVSQRFTIDSSSPVNSRSVRSCISMNTTSSGGEARLINCAPTDRHSAGCRDGRPLSCVVQNGTQFNYWQPPVAHDGALFPCHQVSWHYGGIGITPHWECAWQIGVSLAFPAEGAPPSSAGVNMLSVPCQSDVIMVVK